VCWFYCLGNQGWGQEKTTDRRDARYRRWRDYRKRTRRGQQTGPERILDKPGRKGRCREVVPTAAKQAHYDGTRAVPEITPGCDACHGLENGFRVKVKRGRGGSERENGEPVPFGRSCGPPDDLARSESCESVRPGSCRRHSCVSLQGGTSLL